MPLVPGIALTTSIRDFYNGDYLSGTIHLIDALLTALCIAVALHCRFCCCDMEETYRYELCASVFIAAVATVTFAILFAAPKKELVFCGVSGGLAWLVYFILYRQSGNVVLGSLVATFVLTILSRILAVARCNPATIYLVSGIFHWFREPVSIIRHII